MAKRGVNADVVDSLLGGKRKTVGETTKERPVVLPVAQENEASPLPIVEDDEQRLEALEGVIGENIRAFYTVGCALREIRDKRLYKIQGYSSFEEYCEERWDMGRTYAHRLEAAAAVMDNLKVLPNRQHFLPATEWQVRPLVKLEPEQQREVWNHVIEAAPTKSSTGEPKITAKLVEETVAEVTGQAKPPKEKPAGVRASFHFSEDLDDALNESLYRVKKMVGKDRKAAVSKDLIAEVILQHGLAELEAQGEEGALWKEIESRLG